MKYKLFTLFVFLISFNVQFFAQIKYEKGFIIDKDNSKIECYIKNSDTKNNPKSVQYKILENSSEIEKLDINEVKEFSIGEKIKYKRKVIKIDKSRNGPYSRLSTKMNSEYVSDTVLLKVLIEGNVTLYKYEEHQLVRFFYEKKNEAIVPLDYKVYKVGNNKIGKNKRYKQQLTLEFTCKESLTSDKVEYTTRDLTNYFKKYYSCVNENYTNYSPSKYRPKIKIGIRYELMYASTELYYNKELEADFGNNIINQYGLSIEYILPFRKNKWRIYFEPSYQKYTETTRSEDNFFAGDIELKYSSIEMPIGIRYYMFISDNSKVFVDVAYLTDFFSKTRAKYINNEFLQSEEVLGNISIGVGYSFNRYSISFRHKRKKNLAGNSGGWITEHKGNSLVLKVDLF